MDARRLQRLRGVARRRGRGRWRLEGRRRARLARWHSTEQLGGAGSGKKTPVPLWAGWAGWAGFAQATGKVFLFSFLFNLSFLFFFSVICFAY